MNAHDPKLDVEAASDILTSLRSSGVKKVFEASRGSAGSGVLGAADRLCLAAAPTFALMALLTAVLDDGPPDTLCSAARDAWPLSGMVPMYLLMSVFHSAPVLRLIASRRSGACRS